jgi:hypothetical protein
MAKSFKPIGKHAVYILARLAAKKAVQDELRAQGVRVTLCKPADIAAQAKVYLEQHPELWSLARERARKMGLIDPPLVTPDTPHDVAASVERMSCTKLNNV